MCLACAFAHYLKPRICERPYSRSSRGASKNLPKNLDSLIIGCLLSQGSLVPTSGESTSLLFNEAGITAMQKHKVERLR